ncbi:cell cycle checkpoint RAD17 isoform X1 [Olea europaea subsp. europaea]|uniref:Cell cycle checkpoint RAD17 isoform X1 n=1 Tax=Olea europaea subsp. europaea TaxID=158383 RepID=A0A8S0PCT5_OLEEU|nr:cell cycle checkpoint RAD17 isoform X1 [Olea europaea subsp. europaea]
MGKVKRSSAIVISSSDDEEDKDFILKTNSSYSKSVPVRRTRKRVNRTPLSDSRSRVFHDSNSEGFDVIKRFCEDFDQGFPQFKVSSGSGTNIGLWVDKYKPRSLEELAVQKKKVDEVKTWFEERLRTSVKNSCSNVLLVSGQAGVGKSATVYAVASNLGAQVHEWNTPTPTIWQEHLHNSNSGMRYTSKMDEFESFVERIRKYGLSSMTRTSPSSIILLIDDLPVVNGKFAYGRLRWCLHLLLRSVHLPTALLIYDYGKSDSAEYNTGYWEELQLSLLNAGACKVTFNPITVNSIRRTLSKICRHEQFEVGDEQIDLIAKASGGDIRSAITSLQYFCLKPFRMNSQSLSKSSVTHPEEDMDKNNLLNGGICLPFGRDETLSLFHALGKFLHNKRESGILSEPDRNTILLRDKFVRSPLKMDAPEIVLCQAHGQTRAIADFLHENVLDFVNEDTIDDAWSVSSYLSDADFLLGTLGGTLTRNFEAENVIQSAAASIAVRGVLFGNAHAVTSRWHAIRKPKLWQVEQSLRHNKCQMVSRWNAIHSSLKLCELSVIATEFNPALNWLQYEVPKDGESQQVSTAVHNGEDDYFDNDACDDEIEEW